MSVDIQRIVAAAVAASEGMIGEAIDLERWMDKHGFSDVIDYIEDVEALLTIEECPECGWWVECGELADGDGDPCPCESCRDPWEDDE